jgi:hypothetical protein
MKVRKLKKKKKIRREFSNTLIIIDKEFWERHSINGRFGEGGLQQLILDMRFFLEAANETASQHAEDAINGLFLFFLFVCFFFFFFLFVFVKLIFTAKISSNKNRNNG